MRFSLGLAVFIGVALSASASAALNLQRSVTITDSYGGTFAATTAGSIEIPGADTSSQATLTNFHPHDKQTLTINGSVARTHERANETVTDVYNGSVTLTGTDDAGKAIDDTLVLQDLQVLRDHHGPTYSGTIVFNGTSVNAAQMPEALKHRLREVLRALAIE